MAKTHRRLATFFVIRRNACPAIGDSGGRDALGRAVLGPEDPSSRSPNGGDSSHDRVQPLRHRVTWVDGELWHATWENEESDLRHIDPQTGKILEALDMPPGMYVSGLESNGSDQFFCGGGSSGKVRAVRRPKRGVKATA